ncbi:uncharacterized protein TRIVIDRAFT_217459 [Trichoderma virens Gv29-8]|uniref:SpvB-domain-containing protein n=1 Tax=Hypocrea virens (strain Gv29-8 / FGSC 10586) TaxID=413071 RepID=G9MEN2_HYPVG|nr:uncharacterized protein TRIVIDRAFT_217459 [Trichoderma virens Gv29-8]EHK26850.1 hypothetical protein TRIVIDRAFT_217459 [Trichoderma virens Gv29-8]
MGQKDAEKASSDQTSNAPGYLLAANADQRANREQFNVDTATGGFSYSVPIPDSPGRQDFNPSLSLVYQSGSASINGPFGSGWKLSGLDSISRKVSHGVPLYDDNRDIFIHSRIGELVPSTGQSGSAEWQHNGYLVRIYRPRVEHDDCRIECWTSQTDSGQQYWKTISGNNVTTVYGQDENSRIYNSDDDHHHHVFSWVACSSYDSYGNHIVYSYKAEDSSRVATINNQNISETGRTPASRSTQRYLKSIFYGNRTPNRDLESWKVLSPSSADTDSRNWLFQLVFDYGEHDITTPTPNAIQEWDIRPDPFSVYNSGFEVRTYRRCRRILMFHHFPEKIGRQDCLVKSMSFQYENDPRSGVSYLRSCTSHGYSPLPTKGYSHLSLPPIEFEYTRSPPLHDLKTEEARVPVSGFRPSGSGVSWLDLNGEGSPGILTQVPGTGWYYQNNQSDGAELSFGDPVVLSEIPNAANNDINWQWDNLEGNGLLSLVTHTPKAGSGLRGFYQRTEEGGWTNFVPFESNPSGVDYSHLTRINLSGAILADLIDLRATDSELGWYPALEHGIKGHGERHSTAGGPNLRLSDDTSVFICDMSGDGLSDIVIVENSHVCYWPNTGHGHFAPKIVMENFPWLPNFNPQRIRPADITGSGCTDLIYLLPEGGALVFYNQSGNRWSDAYSLPCFPPLDEFVAVDIFDVAGRGTQSLCWYSSNDLGAATTSLCYVDLMGAQRPGLLRSCSRNMGDNMVINYRSSTLYHREDERNGRPWTTRLPFPLYCVESITTSDLVCKTSHAIRYAYHNGFYDAAEREFRGFQMVDEWDQEDYGDYKSPCLYTKSWFHIGSTEIESNATLPYIIPALQGLLESLGSANIPSQLNPREKQEAYGSLAGLLRRQEIYCMDGSSSHDKPYKIIQHSYKVTMLQAADTEPKSHHAVFRIHDQESVSAECGRGQFQDARVEHSLVLATDNYGNVLRNAIVYYGRMNSDLPTEADQNAQSETVILCSETDYTIPVNELDHFRLPASAERREYRLFLTSDEMPPPNNRLKLETLHRIISEYDGTNASASGSRMLTGRSQTIYSATDPNLPLPLGKLDPYSVEYQNYQLMLTSSILDDVIPPDFVMSDYEVELQRGGYIELEKGSREWWAPSSRKLYTSDSENSNGRLSFVRSRFYLPTGERDPFGNSSSLYLDQYILLAEATVDAVGNKTVFHNNYVHLQPCVIMDTNGNRVTMAMDSLGRQVGVAVMGKEEDTTRDSLDGFIADLTDEKLDSFINCPSGKVAIDLLGNASRRTIYDTKRFAKTYNASSTSQLVPAFQAELIRETFGQKLRADSLRVQITYLNGNGAVMQTATLLHAPDTDDQDERWQLSGYALQNQEGKLMRQFMPYEQASHSFQQNKATTGSSTSYFYDCLDRRVAVLHNDHTWSKTRYGPWGQIVFDVGDTIMVKNPVDDPDVGRFFSSIQPENYLPTWLERMNNSQDQAKREAAQKSIAYHDTPSIVNIDACGRIILIENDNGYKIETPTEKEIQLNRINYSIRGDLVAQRDARNRVVMRSYNDLTGRPLRSKNMDSGEQWSLPSCDGQPFLKWTHGGKLQKHFQYDKLRRPLTIKVKQKTNSSVDEKIVVRYVYGEGLANDKMDNLRGKLYQCYDQSGLYTNKRFDVLGNCVNTVQKYAVDYKSVLDWSGVKNHQLELEDHYTEKRFNALGQIVQEIIIGGHTSHYYYDLAGRLKRLDSSSPGIDSKITPYVQNIEYTFDGQIASLLYGNGVKTTHWYDTETRRLTTLRTNRFGASSQALLQDISHTYDCIGRIVQTADNSQQDIFFTNCLVKPTKTFRYDALGQLIEATGRELIVASPSRQRSIRAPTERSNSSSGRDMRQLVEYAERYAYDLTGNITKMEHAPVKVDSFTGWTRTYQYNETSCIDSNACNNRLSSTKVGKEICNYGYEGDAGLHGCITSVPGYSYLDWDFNDRLRSFSKQKITNEDSKPETTWFVYNASGVRVRKITERSATADSAIPGNPRKLKETLYLPLHDVFICYSGDGATIRRKTMTDVIKNDQVPHQLALIERTCHQFAQEEVQSKALVRYQLGEQMEVDDHAQIISYQEFSPFGVSTYQTCKTEAPRKYRFARYQYDTETGLYICGARYYAIWLGRWMSADPEGTADGPNVYSYVGNDPVNMDDHQGTIGTPKRSRESAKEEIRDTKAVHQSTSDGKLAEYITQRETDLKKKMKKLEKSKNQEYTLLNPHMYAEGSHQDVTAMMPELRSMKPSELLYTQDSMSARVFEKKQENWQIIAVKRLVEKSVENVLNKVDEVTKLQALAQYDMISAYPIKAGDTVQYRVLDHHRTHIAKEALRENTTIPVIIRKDRLALLDFLKKPPKKGLTDGIEIDIKPNREVSSKDQMDEFSVASLASLAAQAFGKWKLLSLQPNYR